MDVMDYYYVANSGGFKFFYFIVVVVVGIIVGCIVNNVIRNKGYDENWFWWGFFFGLIALIVALTKPDIKSVPSTYSSKLGEEAKRTREADMLKNGGWRCNVCKTVNASYTGTCRCGNTRANNPYVFQQREEERRRKEELRQQEEKQKQEEVQKQQENENIQKLKGYKDLLDAGVITQEEFDKKKQELLKV